MSPPRVLLIAEAANPEWVSVPLEGWSLASALRTVADVHLVTQVRNAPAIARAGLVEGRDFTAIDSEAVARPFHRAANVLRMGSGKGWTMTTAMAAFAYPYFERLVWRRFGDEIRAGQWDVVHRHTPLSPTVVSSIAARCAAAGVPFVLGPLNGGVPWPPGFDAERRREREWLSYVRGAYKFLPGRERMLEATRAIIAGSRHTASEIPGRFRDRCVYIPENGFDQHRFQRQSPQDVTLPLRGCFVGRLVPYKGPDMLIAAAAPLLRDGRLVLDIVGDGPMRSELVALAAREGVADAVTFHGNLPHAEVQNVLSQANLLTFPSIREFGGAVVVEAMATGVVPVIVDYAGPGELVAIGAGHTVPLGSRKEIVTAFRARLEAIADEPSELPAMAKRAQERARECLTWEAKARQVSQVYDWVLGRRSDRPSFFRNAEVASVAS